MQGTMPVTPPPQQWSEALATQLTRDVLQLAAPFRLGLGDYKQQLQISSQKTGHRFFFQKLFQTVLSDNKVRWRWDFMVFKTLNSPLKGIYNFTMVFPSNGNIREPSSWQRHLGCWGFRVYLGRAGGKVLRSGCERTRKQKGKVGRVSKEAIGLSTVISNPKI